MTPCFFSVTTKSLVTNSIKYVFYENGKYTAEIIYENNSGNLLAGFQFDLQNGIIDSAYGGNNQNNGWSGSTFFNPTFTPTSSRILSFSFGQDLGQWRFVSSI